jgi:hypothetical protein
MGAPFLYLLGDSHVRSFANDPGFIPLFVGSGRQARWTDASMAAQATQRLRLSLSRIPPSAPVMLVFGEPDIRFTLAETEDSLAERALDACVERRMAAMDRLRSEFPHRIAVLGCVPSARSEISRFVRHYNERLKAECRQSGIPLIDLLRPPICGTDGTAGAEYRADEIHLNARIVPAVRRSLAEVDAEPGVHAADFTWSDFIRIAVAPDVDARVWGNADVDSSSPAYAASEMRRTAAAAISAVANGIVCPRLLVLNAREGHVPLSLPPRVGRSIEAVESSSLRRELAQRLLDFAGRDDVSVESRPTPAGLSAEIVVDLANEQEPVLPGPNEERMMFIMPDSLAAEAAARRHPETGRLQVVAETKSGTHASHIRFGCRSRDDRMLIQAAFARPPDQPWQGVHTGMAS